MVGIATTGWAYGYLVGSAKSGGWFPPCHVAFRCHAIWAYTATAYPRGQVDVSIGEVRWLESQRLDEWAFVSK